jgi:hypothetical protein
MGDYPMIRDIIFNRWGTPEIDFLATSRNCVIDKFASWGPDPRATLIDSFQSDWASFSSVYLFLPIPLIPRVMQKIVMERVRGILIVHKLGNPDVVQTLVSDTSRLLGLHVQ